MVYEYTFKPSGGDLQFSFQAIRAAGQDQLEHLITRSKSKCAMPLWLVPLFFAALSHSTSQLYAAEIKGTVRSATPEYATVTTESDFIPVPGDKAKFFFKLGGAEVSVGSGHVYEITGPNIMVKIDQATGSVAKDQLVRIDSPKPMKRSTAGEATAAITPAETTAPSSSSLGPSPILPSAAVSTAEANRNLTVAREHVMRGFAQYSSGDFDGAIASFTHAIELLPNDPAAYYNRGYAYLQKRNNAAAAQDANKALELKTAVPADAYVLRGTARAALGESKGAMADCNQALKLNPRHALAYNNRASNKLQLRDFDGALADANKSIALDPGSPLPYYNRGYAHMNKGHAGKAIADFNKAIKMQPSYRAELEPLLRRMGGNAQNQSSASSNAASQMADLVNPAQKIVGTWQGARHRKQYFPDGTFVTDPHLVPDPPRLRWRIEGDRLTEYYPEASTTITVRIVSMTDRKLVTTDDQGHSFPATRIPDTQARKEKANW